LSSSIVKKKVQSDNLTLLINANGARKMKTLLITTGGTISASAARSRLAPVYTNRNLLRLLNNGDSKKIKGLSAFRLDSSNIAPEHWTKLIMILTEQLPKYDCVIITHGTDTLPFTAAAVSLALHHTSVPIIFTASLLPIDHLDTDAKRNFKNSLQLGVSHRGGLVATCLDGIVIHGAHVRKILNEATTTRYTNVSAFMSVGVPPIGFVRGNKVCLPRIDLWRPAEKTKIRKWRPIFDTRISLIKIFPGLQSKAVRIPRQTKGVVIEAFGPGNIALRYGEWRAFLKVLRQKGILTVLSTQNALGEIDTGLYETGRGLADLVAAPPKSTTEAVIVKLMWVLANSEQRSLREKRELFLFNVCGE